MRWYKYRIIQETDSGRYIVQYRLRFTPYLWINDTHWGKETRKEAEEDVDKYIKIDDAIEEHGRYKVIRRYE